MNIKKIQVGNVELPNNVLAGPMAGVSDISFRMMLKDLQPGLVYTEMISDKGVLHRNERTLEMCELMDDEHPVALQLFGYDIDEMVTAAQYVVEHFDCDILDVNMGCPVSKVVTTNGGSAHLKTPEHAFAMIRALTAAVDVPVTVKLRIGWDETTINAVEMAQGLEAAGAKMLVVHGRTRAQKYKGEVNFEAIRAVKEAVSIPVIGNGDIKTPEAAVEMMEKTGVDGVMVARGLLNNPWLIEEIKAAFKEETFVLDMDDTTRFIWLETHLKTMIEHLGETLAIRKMRGYATWFVAGMPQGRELKSRFIRMETYTEFQTIVEEYLTSTQKQAF